MTAQLKYDIVNLGWACVCVFLQRAHGKAEKYSNRQGDPQLGVELVLEWATHGEDSVQCQVRRGPLRPKKGERTERREGRGGFVH